MTIKVKTTFTPVFNYTGQPTIPQLFLYWKLTSNYSEPDISLTPLRINLNAGNPIVTSTRVVGKESAVNTNLWGVNIRVTAPGATPDLVADYTTAYTYLRCDNSTEVYETAGIAGCVNVYWTPTVEFPASSYPNIALNIAAGKTAHNNAGSEANPLIKTTRAQKNSNYGNTCEKEAYYIPLIGPRPPPDATTGDPFQCDEYPFASSEQGGPGNTLKWVPARENSSQGGKLGDLYTNNRMLPGDQFYVK